jgi:AraC-like DNA-binding protein
MNDLYLILSIFVTGGLLLAGGLMLLFAVIPDSALLGHYRKARGMMACAYLFFVVAGGVEYLLREPAPGARGIALMQTVTLAIAASQALLFTLALVALVDVRFPGWRHVAREAALVAVLVAGVAAAYGWCSGATFGVVFPGFAALYALLLARYTMLFRASYRRFRVRMDNYFSDAGAGRARWVAFSFYTALGVGVLALLSAVFMSTLVALLFAVVFDAFYLFFAIRFINYAHRFHVIERAMDDDPAPSPGVGEMAGMHGDTFALLEKRVEAWMADKGFTERGVTLDVLAARLYTNSKYLSVYINTRERRTFRAWMSALRVEEAKRLMRECPGMTVNDVAARVGIATGSHFGKQFRAHTGLSPARWRGRDGRS